MWHQRMLYKLKTTLPYLHVVLHAYITSRYFRIKHQEELPQGHLIGPLPYLVFTIDIIDPANGTHTHAAIIAVHKNLNLVSSILQQSLNKIQD